MNKAFKTKLKPNQSAYRKSITISKSQIAATKCTPNQYNLSM